MNQQSKTMRAVAIDEFGGIEKMKVRDLPIPQVDPDEILVHVEMDQSKFCDAPL